jgi:hypothetical protein
MPDYGKPIENDLNFNSLLDFFRGKGKKDVQEKVPMKPGTPSKKVLPKTVRGRDGSETQEFVTPKEKSIEKQPDRNDEIPRRSPLGPTHLTGPMMHPEDKTKIHGLPGAQASLSGGTMESQPGGGKITPVSRTQTMELPTQQEQEAWADEASKTFNNPWESQEHNEAIRAKGGSAWKPKIYENSVEKSLLKLMKGGDEQELNPMEDPPKENEESQALVADGDSKHPKSEVGTNEKLFKMGKYGDTLIKKAHEGEQLSFPGMEPTPKPPNLKGDEDHLVPSTRTRKQKIADAAKKIIEGLKQKRGGTSVEESLLKIIGQEDSEDPHEKQGYGKLHSGGTDEIGKLDPTKGKSQPVEGYTEPIETLEAERTGELEEQRNARQELIDTAKKKVGQEHEVLYAPDRKPILNSILKLMKIEEPRSRQAMETEFPVRHPEGSYDPSIRVSRRSSMDRPTTPDPTQPETDAEIVQREAEAKMNRRTRGGRESGAMGVRSGTPVPDYRPGRSHMTGGAMESRKVPIGKDDMEKGGTFWGGSRKQEVRQPLPQREQPWGRQENEPRKQAGVERSIARLRTPRNWYSSDQGRGNIGDTRGQRKKSIEKEHVGGQGISDQSEGFDFSKPLPKAPITGPDHPEGPGVPLTGGFTDLERETMKESDSLTGSEDYAQDPDAKPTLYQGVTEPWVRPSRAKRAVEERRQAKNPIEESLLKLMKEGEIIPSKVGMTKENATKDLEKVVTPQVMGQKPGAYKAPPIQSQPSMPSAADTEAQGNPDIDVGRMMQYGAYQQAGGVADRLLGIKHPDDQRATGAGIAAGGLKAGAKGVGAVASGIGSLFGGGKKQPEAPKPSSGLPPPDSTTQQNYYSRDIK